MASRPPPMPDVVSEARFEFGRNWRSYLETALTPEREAIAQESLRTALGRSSLAGQSFLDIGCGSGVFSLAAFRLGARVISLDNDAESIACCQTLWDRMGRPESWQVLTGSILDADFVTTLNRADIVYAWGVLHHTGAMWEAIRNAATLVADGGWFYIAIYNEKPGRVGGSKTWWHIKRFYGRRGRLARRIMETLYAAYRTSRIVASRRNPRRVARDYKMSRGMDQRHDWNDWLGGFPYEYAPPGQVSSFCHDLGFDLVRAQTTDTVGCNEFVFVRRSSQGPPAEDRTGR